MDRTLQRDGHCKVMQYAAAQLVFIFVLEDIVLCETDANIV